MGNRQHVCGKCGQVGHNRRTCGKTAPAQPRRPRLTAPGPNTTPEPADTLTHTIRTIENDHTLHNKAEKTGDTDTAPPAPQDEPAATTAETGTETLTAEDLETWWMLASDKDGKRRKENIPPGKTQPRYDASKDWTPDDTERLRTIVLLAEQQGTSPKNLKKFLNRFGVKARVMLAAQPGLPNLTLAVLATDTSSTVRENVAKRIDIPAPILNQLADDPKYDVRVEVARNTTTTTTTDTLDRMFDNLKHLPHPSTSPRSSEGELENALVKHPNSSPHIHTRFITSTAPFTVDAAIQHPDTTAEELETVTRTWGYDSAPFASALQHPHMPTHLLEKYCREKKGAYPIFYALKHSNISAETIQEHYLNPSSEKHLPEKRIPYENMVMFAIASNPRTPDHILTTLAANKENRHPFSTQNKAQETLAEKHAEKL